MNGLEPVIRRILNQHLRQKRVLLLRQAFTLDMHMAAWAALVIVACFFLPLAAWQLAHLPQTAWLTTVVDLFAEGTMAFCLLCLLLSAVGIGRFLRDRTAIEMVTLYAKRLRDLSRVPPAFFLLYLPADSEQRQQLFVMWQWLRQLLRTSLPGCWLKRKAPLLLFTQTPLRFAP